MDMWFLIGILVIFGVWITVLNVRYNKMEEKAVKIIDFLEFKVEKLTQDIIRLRKENREDKGQK